jgi:O-antigen ligase
VDRTPILWSHGMSEHHANTVRGLLFFVLVAASMATQARIGGLGIGLAELSGIGLLAMELPRIAACARSRADVMLPMALLIVGFVVGWMFNLLVAVSYYTTPRDLFAMVYAMLAGLAGISYLGRLPRPGTTLAEALSLALLVQLVPIGLNLAGIDGPWWLGEDEEPGLPFISRYTRLSTNPNQLGVLVSSFPFVALYGWRTAAGKGSRWLLGLGMATCAVIAVLIVSNTVFATYMVTGTLAPILAWNRFGSGTGRILPVRLLVSAAAVLLASAVLAVYVDSSIEKTGDRDANGRFQRWITAGDGIVQSAFLGAGPGGQSGEVHPFEGTEAHNTLLDIALQGGVLAMLAYLVLLVVLWRRALHSGQLLILCVLLAILIQQSTHYTIRHPVNWLYMLLPLVIGPRGKRPPQA